MTFDLEFGYPDIMLRLMLCLFFYCLNQLLMLKTSGKITKKKLT